MCIGQAILCWRTVGLVMGERILLSRENRRQKSQSIYSGLLKRFVGKKNLVLLVDPEE
jgi:hypothetical protein